MKGVREALQRVLRERASGAPGTASLRQAVGVEVKKLIDTMSLAPDKKQKLHEALVGERKPGSCDSDETCGAKHDKAP